jgi:hypothetical protein
MYLRMMRTVLTLLVVTVVELMATLNTSANSLPQGSEEAVGIRLLDAAAKKEAIACGRSGPDCAVTRYLLCASELRPYVARIATPFSRVAASVFEAERSHGRVVPPETGVVNSWGLGLYVLPAQDTDTADAIVTVFLRRGDQIIEPTTTTLAPMTIEGRSGAKSLTKGFFSFPMHTFAPTSDLVVVFVGRHGDSSCRLDRQTLSTLR